MNEIDACGAWADNTTPEWAREGRVTCERPSGGARGHNGPHSARAQPPAGGGVITLSWAQDARPANDDPEARPEDHGISRDAQGVIGETESARQSDGFRGALVDALARGQVEARVLGHDEDGEFVVDEIVELIGIKFRRP